MLSLRSLVVASVAAAESAGTIIRQVVAQGQLGTIDKAAGSKAVESGAVAKDPQTLADRRAQLVIVGYLRHMFPNLAVVGEEDETSLVPDDVATTHIEQLKRGVGHEPSGIDTITGRGLEPLDVKRLIVYVDPLDGTKEFASGAVDGVTTLIGIALDGHPVAGVIHQPFYVPDAGRTIWGAVWGTGTTTTNGTIQGPLKNAVRPDTRRAFAISRSRFVGEIERITKACGPTELVTIGGTGGKVLAILDGVADIFVYPGRLTSKWDICACQAVAEAAGAVLTDKYGMRYSYEQGVSLLNESGIVMSANGKTHREVIEKLGLALANSKEALL